MRPGNNHLTWFGIFFGKFQYIFCKWLLFHCIDLWIGLSLYWGRDQSGLLPISTSQISTLQVDPGKRKVIQITNKNIRCHPEFRGAHFRIVFTRTRLIFKHGFFFTDCIFSAFSFRVVIFSKIRVVISVLAFRGYILSCLLDGCAKLVKE